MRWFQAPWAIIGVGSLASATSCRSATEITLMIHTNVPCDQVEAWHGVAVYVGKPEAESVGQAPTLVTKRCEGDGQIGSLVVVPSGANDDLIGVRVVAGIGQSPEDCVTNGYQGGCIVARRALRFTPHLDLSLEVELSSKCEDIACDPRSSCFRGGCQPALDAPKEPPAPGTPSVRCGDDGVFCPTSGDVCCLTVDAEAKATHGRCMPANLCTDIVLHCDDDTDCPDGGADGTTPGVCALGYTAMSDLPYVPVEVSHSHCLLALGYGQGGFQRPHGLALCEESLPCAKDFRCLPSGDSSALPGYSWCELEFRQ